MFSCDCIICTKLLLPKASKKDENEGNWPDLDLLEEFQKMLEEYGKKAKCDCGAKFTSNPTYHLSWCSTLSK